MTGCERKTIFEIDFFFRAVGGGGISGARCEYRLFTSAMLLAVGPPGAVLLEVVHGSYKLQALQTASQG